MNDRSAVTTFLFTDIEGSTRLWESDPEAMRVALARHDALARHAVEGHRGTVVKMTGDGVCAAFADALDAVAAAVGLQLALAERTNAQGLPLNVRCGMHAGVSESRDNDFFGTAVNRAARIMSAANGGQILLSHAVVALSSDRLPAGVELRDLGAVRLRDLATPEHVYQIVHPRLRRDFPPLRSLESTPNNLPRQITSFVGRERELAEIAAALRSTRLLTLVGTGGLGKTRLSLHVASMALDDFPDGAWFIELAALGDGQLVAQAVASALGVKEDAGRPVSEAVVRHTANRKLLLVLDNCEHLVDACAEFAQLVLRAGPDAKILASSREPLHIGGETIYPVPALAVPDPGGSIAVGALGQYEAVRLFVDRAAAAHPSFHLTQSNAAAVVDICRHLDGIPLAIELAAARVRAMSVERISERLTDRFRLLAGGDRTALPRQQTLRASIDWSHDLLTGPEQAMLRRLAVFAGGWTLEAAEAVTSGGEIEASGAFDLLTRLVEKSLVAMESDGTRYRLLETVRQYASERLRASGEEDLVRRRHLDCYLALAEAARPELAGPMQGAWLARLDQELENLLSAHASCGRVDDGAELGLKLTYLIKPYWFIRGLLGLGHQVTIEALSRPGAQARGKARCNGLSDVGQIECWMGRYDDALGHLGESLAIARELGDKRSTAAVLQPLGIAAQGNNDVVAARAYLSEALLLAQELGNTRELLAALNQMAQLNRAEGELDAAELLYEKMLALARELGDRESIAIGLLNVAMVSTGRGKSDRAKTMLLEVLAIAEEVGSKPAGQSVLEVSAGLGSLSGDHSAAARFFGAAEAETARTGLHRDPTDEAFLAPLIARARRAMGESAFAAAEAAGRALTYDEALVEARSWLGGRP